MNILSLRGIENITQPFIDKLESLSSRNGWDPFGLAASIGFESRFLTVAKNPLSTATGLIQFTKGTAQDLGTTVEALKGMSAVDQLDYVEKFFKKYMPTIPTRYEDYELAVLGRGSLVGASDDTIVYDGRDPKQQASYAGNAGVFDKAGKGYFTVGDVRGKIQEYVAGMKGKVVKVAAGAAGAELLIWAALGFFAWKRAKARSRGA